MREAPSGRRFLTARWTNLVLANFPVSDELATPLLPPGTVLDRFEGSAYVSLVAFEFFDTRVLGCAWPGYRNFLEWNLRVYAQWDGRRGVVFVREFVPPRLVAWAARHLYNEPYLAAPMSHDVTLGHGLRTAEYRLSFGGREHRMRAAGDATPIVPVESSAEHFFKEQAWGYGRTRGGTTLSYRVHHPAWAVHPVRDFDMNVDWAVLYGEPWRVMNGTSPTSVVLCAGSEVAVFPYGTITA